MKLNRICLAVAPSGLTISAAVAKEGGDQYPLGGENWLAGALPPPGHYFLNYFGYYGGDLRDGDKVPGASVTAWFDALRWVKVTTQQLLGVNWAMHVISPIVNQKLSLGSGNKTVTGLGDIVLAPLAIAWHGFNQAYIRIIGRGVLGPRAKIA